MLTNSNLFQNNEGSNISNIMNNLNWSSTQSQLNNSFNSSVNLKQIFSNSEITLHCSASKSNDNSNISATLFVSNNTSFELSNIKLNLSVIKYVSLKVINTSGFVLEPKQSFGIKKVMRTTFKSY